MDGYQSLQPNQQGDILAGEILINKSVLNLSSRSTPVSKIFTCDRLVAYPYNLKVMILLLQLEGFFDQLPSPK